VTEFSASRMSACKRYVPGEQNRGRSYIRLNTNESLYSPPQSVIEAAARAAATMNFYSDPEAVKLRQAIAQYLELKPEQICTTNGSDEVLDYIFAAFADKDRPLTFPDITYSFYDNLASLYDIPCNKIKLSKDLRIQPKEYLHLNSNIVIANPNAQTGLCISNDAIAEICDTNPEHVVIIDEAYAEFERISAVPLLARHANLIIVRTFSKSRFLAGARIGYAAAGEDLIRELETVRYARNPYNVNAVAIAAGSAALAEADYYMEYWSRINKTRESFKSELRALGYEVTDSKANFVLCRHLEKDSGEMLDMLKEKGFLVRKMSGRISEYLRISIGTEEDMNALLKYM